MKISVEEIVLIHDRIISATGGSKGQRETSLLQSISVKPFGNYFGQELYPGVFLKAAVIFEGLINYHVFVDGNKRTGLAVMEYFLHKNEYKLQATALQKEKFTLHVATSNPDLADIAVWIKSHSKAN